MTPDNERPNPWVDPVYDTSTPRPNLHSGIGELREALEWALDNLDAEDEVIGGATSWAVVVDGKTTTMAKSTGYDENKAKARTALATADKPLTGRDEGERLARIIEEADADNPDWARGARFVLGWTKGPDDSALEIAFQRVRDTSLRAATPTAPALDVELRERLATALCSTFELDGHDHDTFLQPDFCEAGLADADALLPFLSATTETPK